MAKNKCPVCGEKVKVGAVRCKGCGLPLINPKAFAKKKFEDEIITPNKEGNVDERTLYIVDRLGLMSKFILVVSFFSVILLFIYSIFKLNVFLIIFSILLYFCLPFVVLPINWMQVMLENLYEIKKNQNKK